jgi:hypothetical protein
MPTEQATIDNLLITFVNKGIFLSKCRVFFVQRDTPNNLSILGSIDGMSVAASAHFFGKEITKGKGGTNPVTQDNVSEFIVDNCKRMVCILTRENVLIS